MLTTTKVKDIYEGNDSATNFTYNFRIISAAHLTVIHTNSSGVETVLSEGVDYDVNGVGSATGTVDYPLSGDPLTAGEYITLWRKPPAVQETDFANQGGFFPETHENAFDLITMIAQYLDEQHARAVKFAVSSSASEVTLPDPDDGKILGWDGTDLANKVAGDLVSDLTVVINSGDANRVATVKGTEDSYENKTLNTIMKSEFSPSANEILAYDGADFVKQGLLALLTTLLSPSNGQVVMYSGGTFTMTDIGLYVPTGKMAPWPGGSAPTGWLLCDGSAVSRTTYSDLHALLKDIGGTDNYAWGNGDGSTTFNVPDMRGRVLVGRDSGQTEFDAWGETGGAKTHTLTEAEMPSHVHDRGNVISNITATGSTSCISNGSGTNTGSTGGDQAHNNLQPYAVGDWIIKT